MFDLTKKTNLADGQDKEKKNGKVNSRSEEQRKAEEMPFSADCSFYQSMRDTYCTKTTIGQFVADIMSTRYKQATENYRRLMAEGKEAEAKKVKDNLPAFVPAGFCDGPHRMEKMMTLTGMTIIDIDHCGDRTNEFMEKLKELPWVKAGWVSVSGEGLKAVARIDARSIDEFRVANKIARRHIGQLLGFECDKQCSDPTRLSFTSHDPSAFYREDTVCFDWRSEGEKMDEIPVIGAIPPTAQYRPIPPANGMIDTFLSEFEAKFAYRKGQRNAWLLAIGRAARFKGMTAGELELLIGKVQQRADETCGTAEIRKKIRSGYGYVNGKFNEHVGAAGATGAAMLFSEPEKNENFSENIESQDDITEHTISALPCLPRCVYTHLNQILLTITNIANTDRERDVLLCSALANLSTCCPEVTFRYRDA
ncbi:MAG: BT4734/BF3469 family protein, partial [Phocaeicola sp.]|uniref:BT4734/BF3469 family protein n=2 Tax=Phocaeicola sp. TaxID=2773926 RepID=UPI003F9EC22B